MTVYDAAPGGWIPPGAAPPLRAYLIRTVLPLIDGFGWGIPGIILMIVSPHH